MKGEKYYALENFFRDTNASNTNPKAVSSQEVGSGTPVTRSSEALV